jgi:hypothetical protein
MSPLSTAKCGKQRLSSLGLGGLPRTVPRSAGAILRRERGVGRPFGFSFIAQESFAHQEIMTAQQLTGYLLTQTNVIMHGIRPFLTNHVGTMTFSATIRFLRRAFSSRDTVTA